MTALAHARFLFFFFPFLLILFPFPFRFLYVFFFYYFRFLPLLRSSVRFSFFLISLYYTIRVFLFPFFLVKHAVLPFPYLVSHTSKVVLCLIYLYIPSFPMHGECCPNIASHINKGCA
ncbi:hypothetical protein BS78_02G004300 [Paspalum vaginatum]|nr:hypothetical protein BS78_02G004300 [Paspalum vaginatum]